MTALATPDDLAAVVVGQTYVEFVLREMLGAQLDNRRRFESMRITFDNILSLALAFPMIPHDYEQVLRKLTAIRNRFAHHIDHTLTTGEVNDAFASAPTGIQSNVTFLEKPPFPNLSERAWRIRLLYVTMQTALSVTAGGGIHGVPDPSDPKSELHKKYPDLRNVPPSVRDGFIAGASSFIVHSMRKATEGNQSAS
jgi:hypothetical protein